MQVGTCKKAGGRRQIFALALLAGALAACGGGDGDGTLTTADLPTGSDRPAVTAPVDEPVVDEPVVDEPVVDEPVVDEPAVTVSPSDPSETDSDGLTSEEWAVVIVFGILVLLIVIGAAALASRRSRHRADVHTTNQRRLDDITRSCRSIHDSAVLSVLQANDPTVMQSTWAAARGQLVDVEARIESLRSDLTDDGQRGSLHELGSAVTGVRDAIESNVNLRLDPEPTGRAELIEASNRTVLYRSEALESALQQVLYLRV
jgi:hypothetical protein